ncbi:uncharacterized protein LOC128202750 isoform X1 [Mya arenaria]|uniref:uncharacterized protein LOC128202750 isoform X1 n=1 Tax=Mya arenaria TaxID=6604 RepID=UPI0022E4DD34|nr:uncharacterized protein LOC128202750 isoform X1 [Mya arenaria]
MAAYRTFVSPESQNWLKQWRAVFITRRAVLPFVESKSSNLHYDIVQKASNEQTCSLDHGRLSDRQQIPCRFHEKLRNEIKVIHKRKKPSWGNASTDTWGDSPFAVAKLFMQPAGYDDKSSFDEIDFNGLAAFIYNCGKYTPTLETLFDEARMYVNKIRHMPDACSSALTDQATTECIDSMLALLNDPEFQGDPEIQEASKQLDELAAYRTFFGQESQNWLKQWFAVFITRRAVLPFVESKSSNLHYDIVQKASNEQTCSLDHGRLSDRQQIPCRFHEKLRNEIKVIHKRKKPSWGNASTDTWGDSPFAVAKLFMQPAGYDDKSSFDEIDFNGLAAFIYNCGKYTPTLETLSDEARKYVNNIRNIPDLCSSALTDQATTECIDSMLALLNDPEFQGDPEILEAMEQLDELKTQTENTNSLISIIEVPIMRGVQEIAEKKEQRKSKLTKAKSDLHQQLLTYYQTKYLRMNVRLDIDAAVEDIYEKPKLILKNKRDKDGKIKDKEISEMNDMFLSENGTMAKTVFVVGEPGRGKSSLCKKIVHDWCKLKKDENKTTKNNNMLSQFGFLFYIRLREAADQCKIKDMLVQCLIEHIHSDDKEKKELLAEILKSECCLLLLDGLDEWTHCSKCKRDERIPHVETSWMNCTTLITTRPYKIAELKLNRSQLGNHMRLEGVQSPDKLVRRILQEFEKSQEDKRPHSCVKDLKIKGLWHFRDIPIVLIDIVWLWFRGQLKVNMCLSEVYGKIIEERWGEMIDKKKIEDNQLPEDFLDSLSKLAFNKLFSTNQDDSIVFGIAKHQLDEKYQRLSLESGIMSCSSKLGERLASYQFWHTTLQEFFSALYLAKSSRSDLLKHCQHAQEVYRYNRGEGVLSMRHMFLFLCSMDITAAEVFSKSLNELFTDHLERNGFSTTEARAFQNMILQGYDEAERSGHIGAEICLQHVVVDDDDDDDDYDDDIHEEFENRLEKHKSILKHYLDKKKSTLVSLYITGESGLYSLLQGMNDPSVLDFEICKNLKFVFLRNVLNKDINQLNWTGLLECKIQRIGLSPANKLVASFLSSDVTRLKILSLEWNGWEPIAEKIFSKLQQIKHLDATWNNTLPNDSKFDLDLRHLEQLDQLSLKGLAFSDVVNLHMLNLRKLEVSFNTQKKHQG